MPPPSRPTIQTAEMRDIRGHLGQGQMVTNPFFEGNLTFSPTHTSYKCKSRTNQRGASPWWPSPGPSELWGQNAKPLVLSNLFALQLGKMRP